MTKPHLAARMALERIRQYVQAFKRHQSEPHEHPKPSCDFVTELVPDGWLSAIRKVELGKGGEILVTYDKPHVSGETTSRIFDVEGFLVQLVLLSFGGYTNIESHGAGDQYYPRLHIRKTALEGRPFVLRLLSNTAPEFLTKEPNDYHDLRLSRLGSSFEIDRNKRPDRGQTGARVGREEAKSALLANYDECRASPEGSSAKAASATITREELIELVDDLFTMLDRRASQNYPSAATKAGGLTMPTGEPLFC